MPKLRDVRNVRAGEARAVLPRLLPSDNFGRKKARGLHGVYPSALLVVLGLHSDVATSLPRGAGITAKRSPCLGDVDADTIKKLAQQVRRKMPCIAIANVLKLHPERT